MRKISNNEKGKKDNYRDKINQYFEKYSDFFINIPSKAVFLEGVLIGLLLEVQRVQNPKKKGNEAFWSSLHNLRVDNRILLELFPKVVNKLKLLQRPYSNLVSEISIYLQDAGSKWDLSNIELSWYFTHGLSSYKYFKLQKKEEEQNE